MMTHDEYTTAVEEGRWPEDPLVPLPGAFANGSGTIQNLLLKNCQSIAEIRSVKGAIRANHFHKTDHHYAYVISGLVWYFEREIGSKEILPPRMFTAGQMFFTPPMKEHAMLFGMDSVIVTFAKNVRSHEEHESDLVRVSFVTPEIAKGYLA